MRQTAIGLLCSMIALTSGVTTRPLRAAPTSSPLRMQAVQGPAGPGASANSSAMPSGSARPPRARLLISGTRPRRTLAPIGAQKLDSALDEVASHIAPVAEPGLTLAQLHLLNPAVHFMLGGPGLRPFVLVDAVTRGDTRQLASALTALGLQHPSAYANDVSGWLPVDRIQQAAATGEVHFLRAAMSRARSGAITSQGDFVQRSAALRSQYPTLTGSGVTVGVLSDSFDCYSVYALDGVPASGYAGYASNGFLATAATDESTGDLPSTVNVVEEASCMNYGAPTRLPFGDEGRAMLQVVHDVAPGAGLAFYTAENGEADFANGIAALAKAGAKVIADDVGYFDEPFYQDGLIAQAIDSVETSGVAYFSAAGNNADHSYETTTPVFGTLSAAAPNAGEYLLDFNTPGSAAADSLPITIPSLAPGDLVAIVVEWDQPYVTGAPASGGATSRIDLCITGASGSDSLINADGASAACTGPNTTGVDPVQILIVSNPANSGAYTAAENLSVQVGLADGTAPPGRLKVVVDDNGAGATINQYATASSTLQGHPGAAGAAAVGAAFYFETPACGTDPAKLESFSSVGGAPILFDSKGNRLATPLVRQKPDFVAPDGVNDTFLGFVLKPSGSSAGTGASAPSQCDTNPMYPSFFGTSAATPHAAAIAALMFQANGALAPTQIYTALQKSALSMGGTTPNFDSGYGFVQADAALASLPPGAPSLTLSSASSPPGGSITITWASVNTSSCTASGGWSGSLGTSGTQTVTAPSSGGTVVYSLTCSNGVGSSSKSADLVVSSGGHGGGGMDFLTLALLSTCLLAGYKRDRRGST